MIGKNDKGKMKGKRKEKGERINGENGNKGTKVKMKGMMKG